MGVAHPKARRRGYGGWADGPVEARLQDDQTVRSLLNSTVPWGRCCSTTRWGAAARATTGAR